ncbi:MAG: twin-arginine translocase TatA/TatE family subunit [Phycisphaerales bacterium]|nr:twin-arginine translocase TatA/TatE family subunit [Phycisphaerales bacterium]
MTIAIHPPLQLAFIQGWEWIILLVLGLMIFGRRLPEIGRSIGKTIVEFKKGMNEVTPDLNAPAQGPGSGSAPGAPHGGHAHHHAAPGTLPPGQPQQGMHGGQPGAAMPQQGTDPYAKGNYPNA